MSAFAGVLGVAYNVITPIVIIVGLSLLVARRFKPDPRAFSPIVIYLFLPFLVLGGIARSEIQADELVLIMGMALTLGLIMALVSFGIARLLGFDRRLESAFMMSAILINAGNYGLPLNQFAYGPDGLQRAIVFYVTTSLIANTFGVFLASRGTLSARESLINIFKIPLVYGLIIGLLLNVTDTALPVPVQRVVDLLGGAAVPSMLVMLGIQLARTKLQGRLTPVFIAAGLRLLFAPLVMVVITLVLGVSGLTRQVAITQASMPTAVIASVLAIQFDADAEFVTASILVGTVASVITLTVLLTLLGVSP